MAGILTCGLLLFGAFPSAQALSNFSAQALSNFSAQALSSFRAQALSSFRVKSFCPKSLIAYSCGGRYGIGTSWLYRTVFPFHLGRIRAFENHPAPPSVLKAPAQATFHGILRVTHTCSNSAKGCQGVAAMLRRNQICAKFSTALNSAIGCAPDMRQYIRTKHDV
jgi:hypothetical protein